MTNGIRIAQRGVDIEKGSDYQMVLDSDVRTPSIVLQDKGTISSDQGLIKIASHKLGFRPIVLLFLDTVGTTVAGDDCWGLDYAFIATVDDNDFFLNTSLMNVYPTRYKYFILNIPVDQDYDAPAVNNESSVSSGASAYGLKIALPGHNTSESKMESFALNTDAKTLQIHAVRWGYGEKSDPFLPGDNVIRVKHNLGYPPLLLTTLEVFGRPELVTFGYIQFPARVSDTDALAVLIPNNRRFGVIIFKDPLNPKEVEPIGVTYG